MQSAHPIERRRYRRYIIPGRVRFHADSVEGAGELVNIGQGGLLLRSDAVLREGSHLTIHAMVSGYPHLLEGPAQVAGAREGVMTIRFLKEVSGVQELLLWLARECCPWTITYDSADSPPAPSSPLPCTALPQAMKDDELETLRVYLYQLG